MSGRRPTLIILGGINGAGKSSAAARMANQPAFATAAFLDPDKAAARIRAAQPHLSETAANFAGLRQISEQVNCRLAAR